MNYALVEFPCLCVMVKTEINLYIVNLRKNAGAFEWAKIRCFWNKRNSISYYAWHLNATIFLNKTLLPKQKKQFFKELKNWSDRLYTACKLVMTFFQIICFIDIIIFSLVLGNYIHLDDFTYCQEVEDESENKRKAISILNWSDRLYTGFKSLIRYI